MKASIAVVLSFALLCVSSQSIIPAEQIPATSNVQTNQKLDEILNRLKAIEDRLDRMEASLDTAFSWQPDRFGILRDQSGRARGYWGVDPNPAVDSVVE